MNKEQIFKIIQARHSDKTAELIEKVTADVFYSGEAPEILADDRLMDKLFKRWEDKQEEVDAAQKVQADDPNFCPICRLATKPIMLAADRPAKWCARHNVIFPVRTKEEAKK